MYKHLLIATDGSELAEKAVRAGLKLAAALGARATAVTVTEPWDALAMAGLAERGVANPIEKYEQRMREAAEAILARVREIAGSIGTECETLHVSDRHPAEGIIEAAKEKGCDLIVMASHGRRGVSRLLLGSQANEVVTLSTVPVLICR
jgi:nucleotide-binding universal stress UspA family protein